MTYSVPFGYTEDMYDYKREVKIFDDFFGTATGTSTLMLGPWGASIASTGTVTQSTVGLSATRLGVIALTTSANAGSSAKVGGDVSENFIIGTGGPLVFECAIRTPSALSTGTETYFLKAGLFDSDTATEATDAIMFRYNHAQASGYWQAVTRSNNVETAFSTTTLVAVDTWYQFRIEVAGNGGTVNFYINGALVVSQTTNIPTGVARAAGSPGFLNLRTAASAGTIAAYLDFLYLYYMLPTYRP